MDIENKQIKLQSTDSSDKHLNPEEELKKARHLAKRYRCDFVDLTNFPIDAELFRSIPAELMFRYNFVPLKMINGSLLVAIDDPKEFMIWDELGVVLGKSLVVRVASAVQIGEILKKSESSQRVLEEATEGLTLI